MTTLSISGLHAGYRGTDVLHGVDLTVQGGECVALLGANGAGKSTLLRTISGLLRPRSGSISIDGTELAGLAPHSIARLGVGHVAEGRLILSTMSVRANLELAVRFAQRHEDSVQFTIDDAYERWPILHDKRLRPAGTLSGGQQQLLAIAQVLVASPRLVLLDEPTAGLAPIMIDEVEAAIKIILDAGVPALLVEQTIELSASLSSRFVVLRRGEIALAGDPEQLTDRVSVMEAYLGSETESSK